MTRIGNSDQAEKRLWDESLKDGELILSDDWEAAGKSDAMNQSMQSEMVVWFCPTPENTTIDGLEFFLATSSRIEFRCQTGGTASNPRRLFGNHIGRDGTGLSIGAFRV